MKKYSTFLLAATISSMLSPQSTAAVLMQHVGFAGANNIWQGTIGTRFTVGASSLLVTSLGIQDIRLPSPPEPIGGPPPPTPPPDGMQIAHDVGLWTTAGDLLGSVVIPAGTAAGFTDSAWRYVGLNQSVLLEAGKTYALAAHFSQPVDAITDNGVDPYAFAMSSDVTGIANLWSLGTFQMPSDAYPGGVPRWAPANLIYTVVPEPTTLSALFMSGLLAFRRRLMRR